MAYGELVDMPGVPVAAGLPTVLLAFRESCVHCRNVAATWAKWMAEDRSARVLAITSDPLDEAKEFAQAYGWPAEVVSIPVKDYATRQGQLLSRTPWAWVTDSNGHLVFQGHGGYLGAVDSVLVSLEGGGA